MPHVVGEDAGLGRQVAGAVDHRPRELENRLLALGVTVEVTDVDGPHLRDCSRVLT